ncbi:hypothetical protein BJY04DRAFT_140101 [Aspergillus karnatakaensis]|uniref:uncharacterized protein n=1 Tax=Aspergillus karnatakaensis TaxID=1810916 RepID=UPI003CCE1987
MLAQVIELLSLILAPERAGSGSRKESFAGVSCPRFEKAAAACWSFAILHMSPCRWLERRCGKIPGRTSAPALCHRRLDERVHCIACSTHAAQSVHHPLSYRSNPESQRHCSQFFDVPVGGLFLFSFSRLIRRMQVVPRNYSVPR